MSPRNYNSILFLTVYLGLVLVGGSSQVLAHAATNSLFDLRNEIEFKDDLDNQPDDPCAESKAKTDVQNNQLFDDYVKLISASLEKTPREVSIEMVGGIDETAFPSLRKDFSIAWFQLSANQDILFSKLALKADATTKKASDFSFALNHSLSFQRCKSPKSFEKIIYDNTAVASSNNQVFIVTRLPRAGIDSFLK